MSAVERLAEVRAAIAAATERHGRAAGAVELVAVSKTYDAAAILPVLEHGQRVFGENKVQEAKGKWPALRARFPDLRLHLIGPLQSNKTAEAVALFDVIETVDREKIAREIAREIARQGRTPRLYVQVNIGQEPQKAGVAPNEAAAFVSRCRTEHGLAIDGLMCIPPAGDAPEPHFERLGRIAREAAVSGLSMGMSGDYEAAIGCGARSVRVGSAIFGARDYG